MKRLFDIVFSAVGLILISPLLVCTAVWIKLDSRGPVFYRQIRVGRYNHDFTILKFRSMAVNSDKAGLITIGGRDARVTKAGYYIRKYKIDELPQLFNVLIGDMSFVGPRPEVRKYVNLYTADQLHVLDVRPGITDAASIKYRNENDLLASQTNPEQYYIHVIMPDKLSMNLHYVSTHSLWGDVLLIMQTLKSI